MQKLKVLSLLLCLATAVSGCAAITALKHPGKKNLEVLSQGTARENVIAYLGAPISTEKEADKTIDIFQFKQGFSGGNKATRAVVHISLDVLTLFIWELVAWPAEVIIDGEDMTVKVVYDDTKRVQDFIFLKRG
jgi:outer membrane protein assembly factor BamE (lipoprotein component of BamABCDE complex)